MPPLAMTTPRVGDRVVNLRYQRGVPARATGTILAVLSDGRVTVGFGTGRTPIACRPGSLMILPPPRARPR